MHPVARTLLNVVHASIPGAITYMECEEIGVQSRTARKQKGEGGGQIIYFSPFSFLPSSKESGTLYVALFPPCFYPHSYLGSQARLGKRTKCLKPPVSSWLSADLNPGLPANSLIPTLHRLSKLPFISYKPSKKQNL